MDQVKGIVPLATGLTGKIGVVVRSYEVPLITYDSSAVVETVTGKTIIDHRGYIVPNKTGTYRVQVPESDGHTWVWVGDEAVNSFSNSTAKIYRSKQNGGTRSTYDLAVESTEKAIPFRVMWINVYGAGQMKVTVTDPEGVEILGGQTLKNDQIISSCTNNNGVAPPWIPWEREDVGGK